MKRLGNGEFYIATAVNGMRSYDIDGVGSTAAEAVRICKAKVKQERKKANFPPYEFMDDIQAVGPLEIGKAYYDLGRAGEIK